MITTLMLTMLTAAPAAEPPPSQQDIIKEFDRLIREAEKKRDTPVPTPEEFRREQQRIIEEMNRISRDAELRNTELQKQQDELRREFLKRAEQFYREAAEKKEPAHREELIRQMREIERQLKERTNPKGVEVPPVNPEVPREKERELKQLRGTDEKKTAPSSVKIEARSNWRPAGRAPAEAQQIVIRSPDELAKASNMPAEEAEKFLAKQFKVEKIDWSKQMVVIATAGTRPTGGYSVEITEMATDGKTMTVKWKLNSPAKGTIVPQIVTHPGQAVLVERFNGEVKFDPPAAKEK